MVLNQCIFSFRYRGPTKTGFAGTIQNIKATFNNSNTLVDMNLKKLSVIYQNAVKYDLTFMLVCFI